MESVETQGSAAIPFGACKKTCAPRITPAPSPRCRLSSQDDRTSLPALLAGRNISF